MPDAASRTQSPNTARETPVPPEARALSTLTQIDYENALLADIGSDIGSAADRTGEQWARAVLEDAPAGTRDALKQGWSALGLELGPTQSDRHVLGWPIQLSTPDFALLGASSALGLHGELLVIRQQHTLLFASFIHYDNDNARALWAGVEDMHSPFMRELLDQAISRAAPA